MRVYQSANGEWIFWNSQSETKTFFTLESEALNMASKAKFAEKAQVFSTTLAQLFRDAGDLEGVYFDEGFNDVGLDPIIDADVVGLGITAANLSAFITVAQELQKFDVGDVADPVVTANYGASVNAMRTDV